MVPGLARPARKDLYAVTAMSVKAIGDDSVDKRNDNKGNNEEDRERSPSDLRRNRPDICGEINLTHRRLPPWSSASTRSIIQLKDKPEIFAIETVELHDRPVLELKDGEDYKDSAALSTGQKCTTILPILLMESERPLLIDQPEDNLDNAFVFETIVQSIAEVRGRRQLIFVTHNPNIPVLGDAARVFALRSTGRAASVANAGTVDDVAGEIMTILEGGRVAFEARRERYGRPVPEARPKSKSKKV
jgi:hypothetical protein